MTVYFIWDERTSRVGLGGHSSFLGQCMLCFSSGRQSVGLFQAHGKTPRNMYAVEYTREGVSRKYTKGLEIDYDIYKHSFFSLCFQLTRIQGFASFFLPFVEQQNFVGSRTFYVRALFWCVSLPFRRSAGKPAHVWWK